MLIEEFNSKVGWHNVILIAWIHGNEKSWQIFLEHFSDQLQKQEIQLRSWTITLINYANQRAVEQNVRQTEENMNRSFVANNTSQSYEALEAQRIIQILQSADVLIDIHDSTTQVTEPFLISEHSSMNQYFPFQKVVSGLDILHPWGTDGYMNSIWKKWFCIECWYFWDAWWESIAQQAVINVLKKLWNLEWEAQSYEDQEYFTLDYIYTSKTKSVKLARPFKDFEKIKAWEVLWIDWSEHIFAPYDWVILFARETHKPWEEVFVFGKSQS